MPYKIEELDFKRDVKGEQVRTRKIFENLKEKAINNIKLTEHEKDFFCLGVKLSQLEDGFVKDYDCCENFRFKSLYLTYFKDLTGKSTYEKVRGTYLYNPSVFEIKKDLKFLDLIKEKWYKTINITKHREKLLSEISKEVRNDLKELEKKKGKLFFRRDKEKYTLNKKKILLQSKYIYCISLQIFELFDNKEFIITLNKTKIEINEFSIIHILNRHFAEITKVNTTKTFHNEDFEPKLLSKKLKDIFNEIDNSGIYAGESINKISFQYNGTDYQIWVNKRIKQIKGKGNVEFNRLETFYPLKDQQELTKLSTNYDLHKINDDLYVYKKKL
ncbi:hypothetical protein BTO06_09870 [Tenacibaculum sp. SZ-18]|uniref:hypothetical protein n=1 Tax=Tenacibaculum sp. SZ-18 TaxID=754423 RepID=UPI000C2D2843|nr:hypothetical protein [Tenacibaculum sp. SZ-18]AUC15427.1 hypothetical protein BTO06_09870 [Tenacibaculum sp. SZ-18]